MPLFSSSTPFDGDVEKATSEMNTTEDWSVIMDICDKVGRTPNGAKDCMKSVVKRLNHKIPHVSMQATILLDACVNNCGRAFHLEVASRDFVSECRTLINGKAHPKVAAQLKQLIKKWAQNDFKSDPALDMIPSMYNSMLKEGVDFSGETPAPATTQASTSKDPNVVQTQQEEDDIAKAIALSLEEEEKKKGTKTSTLYPQFSGSVSSAAPSTSGAAASSRPREPRKVRALYDFEAAEDNELTFKAGEIVSILDDSDANWWKGSTWRGEGLFPANFVTADLSVEVEAEVAKEKKSVQFNEEVEVKEVEALPDVIEIDEDKIDKCLAMLQNADPTGETNPDLPEMMSLEEQCKAMGPLIDTELESIDRKHNDLMDINTKLMDALQMYHHLMKELPAYGYGALPGGVPGPGPAPPGQFPMQQAPPQQQPQQQQPQQQQPQQQQPPPQMFNGQQQQQPVSAPSMAPPPQLLPQHQAPPPSSAPQQPPPQSQYPGVSSSNGMPQYSAAGAMYAPPDPSMTSYIPTQPQMLPPHQAPQQPMYTQAQMPQQPLL